MEPTFSNLIIKDYGTDPAGTKSVDVVSLAWANPPQMLAAEGGKRYQFLLTLRNNYNGSVHVTFGIWSPNYWTEGGWNDAILGPYETRELTGQTYIPCEPQNYTARLVMNDYVYRGWMDYYLGCTIVQPNYILSPAGQPPVYVAWSGLKDFPVPVTEYGGLYVQSIKLPMPGSADQGEIIMRLIGPAQVAEFRPGCVGKASATEMRYGLVDISSVYFYQFVYDIGVASYTKSPPGGLAYFSGKAYATLSRSEPSGLYSIPISIKAGVGAGDYPISFYAKLRAYTSSSPGDYTNYALFMGPDDRQFCLYPVIGVLRK